MRKHNDSASSPARTALTTLPPLRHASRAAVGVIHFQRIGGRSTGPNLPAMRVASGGPSSATAALAPSQGSVRTIRLPTIKVQAALEAKVAALETTVAELRAVLAPAGEGVALAPEVGAEVDALRQERDALQSQAEGLESAPGDASAAETALRAELAAACAERDGLLLKLAAAEAVAGAVVAAGGELAAADESTADESAADDAPAAGAEPAGASADLSVQLEQLTAGRDEAKQQAKAAESRAAAAEAALQEAQLRTAAFEAAAAAPPPAPAARVPNGADYLSAIENEAARVWWGTFIGARTATSNSVVDAIVAWMGREEPELSHAEAAISSSCVVHAMDADYDGEITFSEFNKFSVDMAGWSPLVVRGYEVQRGSEDVDAEDVAEYAEYLGIDAEKEPQLLFIAEKCMGAPLPMGWAEFLNEENVPYYHHAAKNKTVWEHPMDKFFKELVNTEREKLQ